MPILSPTADLVQCPKWAKRADWSKSNASIAKTYRLNAQHVASVRKRLGIPAYVTTPKYGEWTKRQIRLVKRYYGRFNSTKTTQRLIGRPIAEIRRKAKEIGVGGYTEEDELITASVPYAYTFYIVRFDDDGTYKVGITCGEAKHRAGSVARCKGTTTHSKRVPRRPITLVVDLPVYHSVRAYRLENAIAGKVGDRNRSEFVDTLPVAFLDYLSSLTYMNDPQFSVAMKLLKGGGDV